MPLLAARLLSLYIRGQASSQVLAYRSTARTRPPSGLGLQQGQDTSALVLRLHRLRQVLHALRLHDGMPLAGGLPLSQIPVHEGQHRRGTPVVAAVVDLVAVQQPAQGLDVRNVRMRGERVPEEEHRVHLARHDHRPNLLVASQRTARCRADGLQTNLPRHRTCRSRARELEVPQHLLVHRHELPHHLLHVVVGNQGDRWSGQAVLHVRGLLHQHCLSILCHGHRILLCHAVHHGGPPTLRARRGDLDHHIHILGPWAAGCCMRALLLLLALQPILLAGG
mmetsp:Transcript_75804/g.195329  ORF Transcript_75804/g.195329 Transcript_75804/m.195329 type:complete len:280 (-) Transcript_75804:126-965(-)